MKRFLTSAAATLVIGAVAAGSAASVGTAKSKPRKKTDVNAQIAQLYQLQAAFHRAASVSNLTTGDDQAKVDQRIQQMLSLWASDGSLHLMVGNPAVDGNYVGNPGAAVNPEDTTACPPVQAGDSRGNLCTFFRYVAGSFKTTNKLISLTPAFKTNIVVTGNTAKVYFQCHYFDASGGDAWKSVLHAAFDGSASKVNGRWLFQHAEAPKLVNDPPLP